MFGVWLPFSKILQGFLAFLHMSNMGIYAVMWPDMFHRVARRVAAALSGSKAGSLLRKLNKVFKYSRGPFHTSKNGQAIQQARTSLVKALKQGQADDLAEMYMAGVARDLNIPLGDFNCGELIKRLEKKGGTDSKK